jgi:predicted small metal-binding protein
MEKTLKCRDVGLDCDFQTRGETEDEILQRAAAHVQRDHGIEQITPELEARVRAAIRNE